MRKKNNFYKILFHFVGFVFCVVAFLMIFSSVKTIFNVYLSSSWESQKATLIYSSFEKEHNKKSTINILKVKYQYTINGVIYENNKLDFSNYKSNFNLSRVNMQNQYINSSEFKVFVNPNNYKDVVVDNSMPIEELSFSSVFIVFPCFIGILWFFSFFYNIASKMLIKKILLVIPFLLMGLIPFLSICFMSFFNSYNFIMNVFILILLFFWFKNSYKL